jgi:hypothetical protein
MSASTLLDAARVLSRTLDKLEFPPPVVHVYDPHRYAWAPYEAYVTQYGEGRKRAVLLGMNPGPFGMMQTGVPFGEIAAVRDWMEIRAPVRTPKDQHPRRPIEGFECQRSEVSGRRLWGWAAQRFRRGGIVLRRLVRSQLLPARAAGGNRSQLHTGQTPCRTAKSNIRGMRSTSGGGVDSALPGMGDRRGGICGEAYSRRTRKRTCGQCVRKGHSSWPDPASKPRKSCGESRLAGGRRKATLRATSSRLRIEAPPRVVAPIRLPIPARIVRSNPVSSQAMKIQFGLKCPYGRSAAIVARSSFDMRHDRTSSVGQATSYQRCGEALDLALSSRIWLWASLRSSRSKNASPGMYGNAMARSPLARYQFN